MESLKKLRKISWSTEQRLNMAYKFMIRTTLQKFQIAAFTKYLDKQLEKLCMSNFFSAMKISCVTHSSVNLK